MNLHKSVFWNDIIHFFCSMRIITFHMLLQKDLDFTLKVIGGELTAIPGISDAIEVQSFFFPLTSDC